jgi:hypothetical protein
MSGTIYLPLKVVDHDEWLKGTSKLFARRSEALQSVDSALLAYQRQPTAEKLERLRRAFTLWKLTKLGDASPWKGGGRDKNQLVTLLDQQLNGQGDTDILNPTLEFMRPDLVNARRGVVYLFSHMDIDDSIFKVVVNGALDLTTASIDYSSAQLQLSNAGLSDSLGRASTGLGAAKSSGLPGTAADKAEDKLRGGPKSLEGTSIDWGAQTVSAAWIGYPAKQPTDSRLLRIWQQVHTWILEMAQKIYAAIREKVKTAWDDKAGTALQTIPGLLRKLVDFLVGKFLATAAPVIGGVLDLAGGVLKTVTAAADKYKEWLVGRNVELLGGHPGTIVEAIRNAMWLSVGEGLYSTLKGSVKLGLDIGAAGASTIASLVISVAEALATTIWRIVEIARMRSFFTQAREQWLAIDEANSLHLRPIEFNNWYKGYALTIPALAVLTLNTGLCGDKMRFLKMFKDNTYVISQSEFDRGVGYVDKLKVWGSKYLEDAGFSFSSKDGLVSHCLELAKQHKETETVGSRMLAVASGFLG